MRVAGEESGRMSEYRIHQDINLFEIVDEYAKRLQEQVDEMALDMAAEMLAKYGYVKVVRCRDCKWFDGRPNYQLCRRDMSCDEIAVFAEPNGFCAWGVKRKEGE